MKALEYRKKKGAKRPPKHARLNAPASLELQTAATRTDELGVGFHAALGHIHTFVFVLLADTDSDDDSDDSDSMALDTDKGTESSTSSTMKDIDTESNDSESSHTGGDSDLDTNRETEATDSIDDVDTVLVDTDLFKERSTEIASDRDTGTDNQLVSNTDADHNDDDYDTESNEDSEFTSDSDTSLSDVVDTGSGSDDIETDTRIISDLSDCANRPDYSQCKITTVPDRDYDICIDEQCISPGYVDDVYYNVSSIHFPLSDTGQISCFDNEDRIDCPEVGSPFYGQDAQYGTDLVVNAFDRFERDTAFSDQPIVIDTLTNLVWQGCDTGLEGVDCTGGERVFLTWYETFETCESLVWAGFHDWRMPNVFELVSIMVKLIYVVQLVED